jgi:mannitol/fructose-specific phosphotransferase system IIA component (Ntr-type)
MGTGIEMNKYKNNEIDNDSINLGTPDNPLILNNDTIDLFTLKVLMILPDTTDKEIKILSKLMRKL